MAPLKKRFVLVTGAPRSGTTAIGTMLGEADGAAYLYEPLNADTGMRTVREYFPGPAGSGDDSASLVESVLALRMPMKRGAYETDTGIRAIAKNLVGGRNKLSYLKCRMDPRVNTVIWKDPFASFLVPHITRTAGIPAVVTVRSPFGLAASFKRLGWGFDLSRLSAVLTRDVPHLAPASASVLAAPKADPVATAATLWSFVYGYLAYRTLDDPLVHWLDVDGLIESPTEAYRQVFAATGLEFTDHVRRRIAEVYEDRGDSVPASGRAHDPRRNVNDSSHYWKSLLTAQEVATVARLTGDVRGRVDGILGGR